MAIDGNPFVSSPPQIPSDSILTAGALCAYGHEGTDWGEINRVILGRYSMAGLRYIKEKAWKIARG